MPKKLAMIADESRDLIPGKGSASLSYMSTGRSCILLTSTSARLALYNIISLRFALEVKQVPICLEF